MTPNNFRVKNGLTVSNGIVVEAGGIAVAGGINANGTFGSPGQGLVSNGSAIYWADNPGYTGSQGTTGYTGSQGDVGYTGSKGDDGYVGADGYTGSRGDTGYTGSQGEIGYTGSQGEIGYTGSRGADGYVGADGYTGSQGEIGYTGSQGEIGYTGSQGVIGYTGSQGEIGYTGSKGADGNFGGASFYYQWDNETNVETVANGYVLLSNSNPVVANVMSISIFDRNSANIQSFIQTIDDSTSAIKGSVKLTEESNTLNFVIYNIVDTHTDHSNHYDVPISYVAGSVTPPANGTNIVVSFLVNGDKGDIGYTGSKGDTGYTGSIGYTGSKGTTYTANTAPTPAVDGDTWWNTDTGIRYVYYDDGTSAQWVQESVMGPMGITGYTGSQGGLGYTGSIGYTGSQGDIGYTGSLGGLGYTGSIGYTGSKGDIGYTGSMGAYQYFSYPISIVSTTSQAANTDYHYVLANTSSTTVTLPSTPASGDLVWVTVANGRTDNVIARNGKNIQGLAEDLILDSISASVMLRYVDSTVMWRIV